jgi:diguanylate cyclase (GGDEF)-like protein
MIASPLPAQRLRFLRLDTRPVENKVLFGFLAGLLFVAVFGAVTVRDTRAYLQGYDTLFVIDASISATEALLKSSSEAQAAQLGFLQSGDAAYHDSFKQALADTEEHLGSIESLLGDDPAFKAELPELHRVTQRYLAGLARDIELGAPPRPMPAAPAGNGLSDAAKIRAAANRILIVRHSDKINVRQMTAARARSSWLYLTCLAACLVLLIGALYWMIMAQLREKRLLTKRLSSTANHDTLTGLPNQALLADWLTYSIAQARLNNAMAALLYIDLDGFARINDLFGRAVGDLALVEIGQRFSNAARESDLISRPGEDEFVVLLSSVSSAQDVAALAARLIESLNEPVLPVLYDQIISASIGIVLYPADGRNAAELLAHAKHALALAKAGGKRQYRFFTAGPPPTPDRQSLLLSELGRALERRELSLVYQPQFDLRRGQVVGVEALLRWNHPSLGAISPAEFIPLAESSGLIIPIGVWVIRTACAQAAQWLAQGGPPLVMAINIAPSQLRGGELIEVIEQALTTHGLDAAMLEIELTERVLAQHNATAALKALKALGLRIAIDDFGTGYSSLNYLKRFAIDVIKLDQSFVAGLPNEIFDSTIAKTIISVARNLGMGLIAEGVETSAQLRFLEAHGCDHAQGYLFSRPLPPQQLATFIDAHRDAAQHDDTLRYCLA